MMKKKMGLCLVEAIREVMIGKISLSLEKYLR